MTIVATSKFFQDRSSLIKEIESKKCPKKSRFELTRDQICLLWRKLCEFFCPKFFQKRLAKQLEGVKTQLSDGQYQKKVEDFYKKFVDEAKAEAKILKHPSKPQLEQLFQMPLDTKESIREFCHALQHQFGYTLQGKLLLLSDCFEWKEKMAMQREEVVQIVAKAKVRKTSSYDQISHMIKKVKQFVLVQSKDVQSYCFIRKEFSKALSESTLQEAAHALSKLDQEKNKYLERYREKKCSLQACVEKLKKKSNPSKYRLNDLNSKLKFVKMQLKATQGAFSDLYRNWQRDMNEVKTHVSSKICCENLELLSFWKKKLTELVKGKQHLDLFIEMLIKLDRICLNLKSKDDLNGKKLVESGLSISLNEAIGAFILGVTKVRELIDCPKQVHDQISKLLDNLVSERQGLLEAKTHQFLTKGEDKLLLALQQCGLKRGHVPKGENSLFDACIMGIKSIPDVAPEFKEMDGKTFRKAIYNLMENNKKKYLLPLVNQLKEDPLSMYLISDETFEKNRNSMDLELWLLTDGAHEYLKKMPEASICPGELEIKVASELLNIPIHIHKNTVEIPLKDKSKGLQLLCINGPTPYFDALLAQNI